MIRRPWLRPALLAASAVCLTIGFGGVLTRGNLDQSTDVERWLLEHDFGLVSTDERLTHTFVLENSSESAIHLSEMSSIDRRVVASWTSDLVPPGESCHITVAMDAPRRSDRVSRLVNIHGVHDEHPVLLAIVLHASGRVGFVSSPDPNPKDDDWGEDASRELFEKWFQADALRKQVTEKFLAWAEYAKHAGHAPTLLVPAMSEEHYRALSEADRQSAVQERMRLARGTLNIGLHLLNEADGLLKNHQIDDAERICLAVLVAGRVHSDAARNMQVVQALCRPMRRMALERLERLYRERDDQARLNEVVAELQEVKRDLP